MPLVASVVVSLAVLGQVRPDPRLVCPASAPMVELPAAAGARVLRCVDNTDGLPDGTELWLSPTGFFLQRGVWSNGVRNGLWERWYPSGHLRSRITFRAGQLVSALCLSEAKRKEVQCADDFYPADWAPPGSAPARAQAPAQAPAAGTQVAPGITSMPELPPAPPLQPYP